MSTPASLKIKPQATTNLKYYRIQPGQSVYDVCLQVYGTLDYLVKLMTDNNFVSTNEANLNGRLIKFDSDIQRRSATYNDNINRGVVYATAVISTVTEQPIFNAELREDVTYELREDGSIEYRE